MKAKTTYQNNNIYTLHYSPKLTHFLLADSNVHHITPPNSSPNTSNHSHQRTNRIGKIQASQDSSCGQNLQHFLNKVENKIKNAVQNFILSIAAEEKISFQLEESIETLLLNMLNISKEIKLFTYHPTQSSPSISLSHNPQSYMLIQEGNDLPILNQYPSYEQYQQESHEANSEDSETFVGAHYRKQNKTSFKKGYKDIHKHKYHTNKGTNHFIHRNYAHTSGFDSDNFYSQQQELSMSDKQTQSEIGAQDHPLATSILPKKYARSSHYHTSNSKYIPNKLFKHQLNQKKQKNSQKQVQNQESISEYYLESSNGSKLGEKENQKPSININQFSTGFRGQSSQNFPSQAYLQSQVLSRKKIF